MKNNEKNVDSYRDFTVEERKKIKMINEKYTPWVTRWTELVELVKSNYRYFNNTTGVITDKELTAWLKNTIYKTENGASEYSLNNNKLSKVLHGERELKANEFVQLYLAAELRLSCDSQDNGACDYLYQYAELEIEDELVDLLSLEKSGGKTGEAIKDVMIKLLKALLNTKSPEQIFECLKQLSVCQNDIATIRASISNSVQSGARSISSMQFTTFITDSKYNQRKSIEKARVAMIAIAELMESHFFSKDIVRALVNMRELIFIGLCFLPDEEKDKFIDESLIMKANKRMKSATRQDKALDVIDNNALYKKIGNNEILDTLKIFLGNFFVYTAHEKRSMLKGESDDWNLLLMHFDEIIEKIHSNDIHVDSVSIYPLNQKYRLFLIQWIAQDLTDIAWAIKINKKYLKRIHSIMHQIFIWYSHLELVNGDSDVDAMKKYIYGMKRKKSKRQKEKELIDFFITANEMSSDEKEECIAFSNSIMKAIYNSEQQHDYATKHEFSKIINKIPNGIKQKLIPNFEYMDIITLPSAELKNCMNTISYDALENHRLVVAICNKIQNVIRREETKPMYAIGVNAYFILCVYSMLFLFDYHEVYNFFEMFEE